ncbi:RNA transcription, translation and transport factor protein [Neodiprion pinetum]|uniref:RNA transcription, translation and transport factor protein n=1 Tax=Neodiprion pinetum TaxID=441929 RepID=UPI001EE033A2|nr:RNA transcription, translation and transport factor protein [Neodiprion pinetum]XP_046628439.1 RNA transcription, translation and transport factor protein [Neodiprion virginianus]
MFKRKLKALDYIDRDKINANDPQHFRKLVVWLEDQKIRHYKIEDRKDIRDINSTSWPETFKRYCEDVACPITTQPVDQLEWLIGFAIKLEFEDNYKKYQPITGKSLKDMNKPVAPNIKSSNPLDNLDFHSAEFKNGIEELRKLLCIPRHSDHLVTLQACSKIVCKRLNAEALLNPKSIVLKGKEFPILEAELGFNMGDPVLNNAAKILRLLYIQDLRDLQTRINETIVSVQNITANPRTDTKLGKVGR